MRRDPKTLRGCGVVVSHPRGAASTAAPNPVVAGPTVVKLDKSGDPKLLALHIIVGEHGVGVVEPTQVKGAATPVPHCPKGEWKGQIGEQWRHQGKTAASSAKRMARISD